MIFLIRSKQKWVPPTLSKWFRNFFLFGALTAHPFASSAAISKAPTFEPETEAVQKSAKAKKSVFILPLITFYDVNKDSTYNWWSELETESLEARTHSETLLKLLSKDNGKVLRFLDPYARNIRFKDSLQKTVLTNSELLAITKDLGAELVLTGDVVVDKSALVMGGERLKINIKILRAPAFNQVGEVFKVVDLYASDYAQLLDGGTEVWSDLRASLEKKIEDYKPITGSNKLELIVTGTFDHNELQRFHRFLKGNITNIKNIAPGFQERDSFGIFVEYSGKDAEALSKELKETKLEGFMTQVVSSTNSQVIFDVRPLNKVK